MLFLPIRLKNDLLKYFEVVGTFLHKHYEMYVENVAPQQNIMSSLHVAIK